MIWSLALLLCIFFLAKTHNVDCPSNPTKQQLINTTPDCFLRSYDAQKFNGPQIINEVKKRMNNIQNYLQQLHMNTINYINAEPVIKWAQSQTQIFINFKLSHRFDSPPCSDIKEQHFQIVDVQFIDGKDIDITQKIIHPFIIEETKSSQNNQQIVKEHDITSNQQIKTQQQIQQQIPNNQNVQNNTQSQNININTDSPQNKSTQNISQQPKKYSARIHPSSVAFQGQCYLTHQKFHYTLNITLNYALNKITIRKQSLGSYTLIGDKNITMVWRKPFATHHKMSIWSQMRQKYQSAMDQYFRTVEDQQEKQNKKTKRRRRRRPVENNKTDNSDQPVKNIQDQQKPAGQDL